MADGKFSHTDLLEMMAMLAREGRPPEAPPSLNEMMEEMSQPGHLLFPDQYFFPTAPRPPRPPIRDLPVRTVDDPHDNLHHALREIEQPGCFMLGRNGYQERLTPQFWEAVRKLNYEHLVRYLTGEEKERVIACLLQEGFDERLAFVGWRLYRLLTADYVEPDEEAEYLLKLERGQRAAGDGRDEQLCDSAAQLAYVGFHHGFARRESEIGLWIVEQDDGVQYLDYLPEAPRKEPPPVAPYLAALAAQEQERRHVLAHLGALAPTPELERGDPLPDRFAVATVYGPDGRPAALIPVDLRDRRHMGELAQAMNGGEPPPGGYLERLRQRVFQGLGIQAADPTDDNPGLEQSVLQGLQAVDPGLESAVRGEPSPEEQTRLLDLMASHTDPVEARPVPVAYGHWLNPAPGAPTETPAPEPAAPPELHAFGEGPSRNFACGTPENRCAGAKVWADQVHWYVWNGALTVEVQPRIQYTCTPNVDEIRRTLADQVAGWMGKSTAKLQHQQAWEIVEGAEVPILF